MVRSLTCLLDGTQLSIEEALRTREEANTRRRPRPDFRCVECGEPVRAERAGPNTDAHFEHRRRNDSCSLCAPPYRARPNAARTRPETWLTTAELARRTAGGDGFLRFKNGNVVAIAITPQKNENAPEILVVGKGPRRVAGAEQLVSSRRIVPLYMKREVNAWEFIGRYRAYDYRSARSDILKYRGSRPLDQIAGILFLESTDEPVLDLCGGSFGDPESRRKVERAAINFVSTHFSEQRFQVRSREKENCGYDLLAERGSEVLFLEVKGTSLSVPRFFISRNEYQCATRHPAEWRLVVVSNALTSPTMVVLTPGQMEEHYKFEPLCWECTPQSI